MPPTTDEDIRKKSEELQKLRDKVAAADARRLANEASVSNDLAMAQLEAEGARLEAQLAAATAVQTVTAVRDGVAGPIASAKEQMETALAQKKAAEASPEAAASVNTLSDTVAPPADTAGTTGPDTPNGGNL